MNKRLIDDMIPDAYNIIKKLGIANAEGKIGKEFRGYISAYGAAIVTGSLIAATAFYTKEGGAKEKRPLLMRAIYALITKTDVLSANDYSLYEYIKKENTVKTKEKVINSAIAIKLALNFFEEKKELEKGCVETNEFELSF